MNGGNGEPFCGESAAVPNRPARGQRQVVVRQMNEATLEPATDASGRNMMSALLHALPHSGDGLRGAGQPELMEFDFVT